MPQETFDRIFKGGTVVNQDGEGLRDIGVTDGRIVTIGNLDADQAGDVIDCTGLHILPGVIDSQVHFREPGAEAKETLESGARAAVLGGVTAVFEMPNTNPTTTTRQALADKVARGRARMALRLRLLLRRHPPRTPTRLASWNVCRRLRRDQRCSWAPPPARCWSRRPRRGAPSAGQYRRRRVSVHSEDEAAAARARRAAGSGRRRPRIRSGAMPRRH
jgi:hypothetical protein